MGSARAVAMPKHRESPEPIARAHTPTHVRSLCLEERAEHLRPPSLEVDFPLEPALQESLDSLLRFRPRQRHFKGVESVEESVGGWQRNLVDERFGRCDGATVEGGDPPGEEIDKAIQLCIGKGPVDVSVSCRSVAVEVIGAENDLERAATAHQVWEALRTAAAWVQSHPDFGLTQSGVLTRREAHVAGEDELAAHASAAPPDRPDADTRRLGETDERIRQNRET